MVSAWCSDNPKQTLTKLKKGKDLKLAFCDTQPVAKHYTIGQKLGISGTPAIVTKSGELFPGYYPPDELLEKLKVGKPIKPTNPVSYTHLTLPTKA